MLHLVWSLSKDTYKNPQSDETKVKMNTECCIWRNTMHHSSPLYSEAWGWEPRTVEVYFHKELLFRNCFSGSKQLKIQYKIRFFMTVT